MEENRQPRLRFRLRSLLVGVVLFALLLVVIIQQIQIVRMSSRIQEMKQTIDASMKSRDHLAKMVRELRDWVEKHR